jgi:hypothetical protein
VAEVSYEGASVDVQRLRNVGGAAAGGEKGAVVQEEVAGGQAGFDDQRVRDSESSEKRTS